MTDPHTPSTFRDGEPIPFEVVSRGLCTGYTHLAITDHVDTSNVENVVGRMVHVCSALRGKVRAEVYPGVEVTHVPPGLIAPLAALARERGPERSSCTGRRSWNLCPRAPILRPAGQKSTSWLIPASSPRKRRGLAGKNGVSLEITSREGHSLKNGHESQIAAKTDSGLVYNTDSHSPGDFTPWEDALRIIRGAGLSEREAMRMQEHARQLLGR